MMKFEWTREKKEVVINMIEDYIVEHEATCSDSVHQSDQRQIGAINVMGRIVDVVGAIEEG